MSVKPCEEGGGLATLPIIFVSYYYKTETNSLPSQLAVVSCSVVDLPNFVELKIVLLDSHAVPRCLGSKLTLTRKGT